MKNKTIFISGSSSGIGYGLANYFLNKKYTVIINGRDKKKNRFVSKKLNNCLYITKDITNKKNIQSIFNFFKKKKIKIDIIIANFGNSSPKDNDMNLEIAFKNNFFSAANTVIEGTKYLKKNGKVICISSICSQEYIKGAPLGYSLAKLALNGFVKFFSKKIAKNKITVNAVTLGNIFFKNSVWMKKMKKNPSTTKKYIKQNVPIGQFGKIEDVCKICEFIINDRNNYITGSNFIIDGGQTNKLN